MRLSKKWQAVLFDLDGTLLDTAPDFVTATKQLLKDQNKSDVPDAVIRNAVSYGSKGIIKKTFGLDDEHPQLEPLRLELIELYFDRLHQLTRPFPGIIETLSTLKERQIPWGIVTNKPSRFTNAILERLPFDYAPSTVICPDHVTHTKPHPEPILKGCEALKVSPQNTVYIGDHIRDIEAGKAAGTDTITALYGYITNDENPLQWGADHTIEHANEIITLLSNQPNEI